MEGYIKYCETKERYMDREELHRQIGIMIAEQNLPEAARVFFLMLEDIYKEMQTIDILYERLKEVQQGEGVTKEEMELLYPMVKMAEDDLSHWEQYLLSK